MREGTGMTNTPTAAELAVLEHLVAAWSSFAALPIEHADDVHEFRQVIHAAQMQILARPARRFIKIAGSK